MSNSNPKKLSHRSCNRTPKPYRWADIGSEALVYFTVLWGPWAFGNVHDWAITTMNLANYGIGLLLLTKWITRWKTGYQPARWTSHGQNGGKSGHPKRDWRTKTIGFLSLYMLGYILVSILNARSAYNWDFNLFEFEETYIKWLPHTYDKTATLQSFYNFLGLACCFWGVRDWLLGKTRKERMEATLDDDDSQHMVQEEFSIPKIPIRLKRLLWLLSINGGLLALIGIVQRLDGTPKLLWLLERERFGSPTQGFGPFGYRGNGASYLNMTLPITVGFFLWLIKNAKSIRIKTGRKLGESHYTLIPVICMMIAAQFISLSRGGFIIFLFMVVVSFVFLLVRSSITTYKQKAKFITLLIAGVGLSSLLGLQPLLDRFKAQHTWYETSWTEPIKDETILYKCELPAPPYDYDFILFRVTNSKLSNFAITELRMTLKKDGRIVLLLNKSHSNIVAEYPTTLKLFESGNLDIAVNRSKTGIEIMANGQRLKGKELKSGVDLDWNTPIIPNEIFLYPTLKIKDKEGTFNTRLLEIHPPDSHLVNDGKPASIRLDFSTYWNLTQLSSILSSRDRIYKNSWAMKKEFNWLGCGSGAWSAVYSLYRDADEEWDAWAHCDLLEYWITFGFFGLIPSLALFGLILCRSRNITGFPILNWIHISLFLAIAGCIIHSFVDFPLQIVSIMHLMVIISAIKMVTFGQSTSG